MSKKQRKGKATTPYEIYEDGWNNSKGEATRSQSKINRIIFVIVAIILFAACCLWVGFGYAVEVRNGAVGTPKVKEIKTYEDLKKLEGKWILNNEYKLMNDVTLTEGQTVTIGSAKYPFTGKFDGGGNTITYEYTQASAFSALFGYTAESAEISDLKVSGSAVLAENGVGAAIVAYNRGKIKECTVNGFTISVNGSGASGGIAAHNYGTIEKCNARVSLVNLKTDGSAMVTFFGGMCAKNHDGATVLQAVCDIVYSGFPETEIYDIYDDYNGGNFYVGSAVGQNEGTVTGSVSADRKAYISDRFNTEYKPVEELDEYFGKK